MEGAAEGGIVGKRTGDGLEAPVPELLDEGLLQALHDHPLLVEHQHIDAEPAAAHRGDAPRDGVRFGGDEDVPRGKHRWEPARINVVRID